MRARILRFLTSLVLLAASILAPHPGRAEQVDFNREIRPILADKCYLCHGPDAKEVQGGLRLDLREVVTAPADSGEPAILPGHPQQSELIRRVTSDDDAEIMPPEESRKTLSAREIELLKRWVEQGAEYQVHWSFARPQRRAAPDVAAGDWVRNEIDRYVLARLESQGMTPSAEASRETLIRRVSLDVRGLPPSVKELQQFLDDKSPAAYERMVDRMLDSPHFGEKMARIWMDLARYGDTNGYHYDSTRQVWLWRDWVIRAYNENMPFNQFTIEQLAGDLLPDATLQQKIASGFNRNTRYNEEGGADPDEWRVEYAKDRTRTLGQVWLGITLGCADCHSHKYDPVSQREFYQLYAFFNSLEEPGAQGHNQKYPPLIEAPTGEQQRTIARLELDIAATEGQIREAVAGYAYSEPQDLPATVSEPVDVVWIDDDAPDGAQLQGEGSPAWNWITAEQGPVHRGERATRRSGAGLNQHFFTGASQPLEIQEGDRLFAWVWLDPNDPPQTVQLQFNDGGWDHRALLGPATRLRRQGGPSESRGRSAARRGPMGPPGSARQRRRTETGRQAQRLGLHSV